MDRCKAASGGRNWLSCDTGDVTACADTADVVCGHVVLHLQGSISFPIFVLHGALGQLFYKKIVATKVG